VEYFAMLNKIYKWAHNQFNKSERGFSLVELLIASMIMGAVLIVFIMALNTLIKTSPLDSEQVIVARLAKTQMENVKMQGYKPDKIYTPIAEDTVYSIDVTAIWYVPATGATSASDTGIEKITVTVYKGSDVMIVLEDLIQK
jgi:prepilin-type N-terminal cleavage/methylation domain-containing protein